MKYLSIPAAVIAAILISPTESVNCYTCQTASTGGNVNSNDNCHTVVDGITHKQNYGSGVACEINLTFLQNSDGDYLFHQDQTKTLQILEITRGVTKLSGNSDPENSIQNSDSSKFNTFCKVLEQKDSSLGRQISCTDYCFADIQGRPCNDNSDYSSDPISYFEDKLRTANCVSCMKDNSTSSRSPDQCESRDVNNLILSNDPDIVKPNTDAIYCKTESGYNQGQNDKLEVNEKSSMSKFKDSF